MPNPDVAGAAGYVDLLREGGGWALAVLASWVARYLYREREADRKHYEAEKQQLNDRLLAVAERQNLALEKGLQNQQLIIEAMQPRQVATAPPR